MPGQRKARRRRSRQKSSSIRNCLSRSAIPARFEGRTFDSYQAEEAKSRSRPETCRAYAGASPAAGRRAVRSSSAGTPGPGKRTSPARIGGHVIREHALAAVYMTVGRAFRTVKDTYRRDCRPTEEEVLAVPRRRRTCSSSTRSGCSTGPHREEHPLRDRQRAVRGAAPDRPHQQLGTASPDRIRRGAGHRPDEGERREAGRVRLEKSPWRRMNHMALNDGYQEHSLTRRSERYGLDLAFVSTRPLSAAIGFHELTASPELVFLCPAGGGREEWAVWYKGEWIPLVFDPAGAHRHFVAAERVAGSSAGSCRGEPMNLTRSARLCEGAEVAGAPEGHPRTSLH